VIKEIVEEFAGQAFSHAERLVLRDETEVHTGLAIFAQRLEKVEIRGRRGRDSSRASWRSRRAKSRESEGETARLAEKGQDPGVRDPRGTD
jgi:hypothetical protein